MMIAMLCIRPWSRNLLVKSSTAGGPHKRDAEMMFMAKEVMGGCRTDTAQHARDASRSRTEWMTLNSMR